LQAERGFGKDAVLMPRNAFVLSNVWVFLFLCLSACSVGSKPPKDNNIDQIKSFRIEANDVWEGDRDAFVVRKDGSGFYEKYRFSEEPGNIKQRVISHVDFQSGTVPFDQTLLKIQGLYDHFGDDQSIVDFEGLEGSNKDRKVFPCGSRATDHGSFVIYWNMASLEDTSTGDHLPHFFVVDRGCQSSDARKILSSIRSVVATIEKAALVESK
jgi:hypothetical protein